MANHLTPDELSKEYGMKREDVIKLCHEQAVPIYHGKIDKSLFQAVREELHALPVGAAGPAPGTHPHRP